ncbi:MAG: GAF domain-containing protein, partial [Xanthomonadales bacterium]
MTFIIDRQADSNALLRQAQALLADCGDAVANAANLASFLFHVLDDVNWVGFYFVSGDELLVGPFQGKPACVRIPLGRGVCGTAAATRTVQRVDDVHAFAGHIACDADTRSEIELPLVRGKNLMGVLDLDSPRVERFTPDDQAFLEQIAG